MTVPAPTISGNAVDPASAQGGNGTDAYGAQVTSLGGDWCVVEYNGLDANVICERAGWHLANGHSPLLTGRVDPERPNMPPHKTPWRIGTIGYNARTVLVAELRDMLESVVRQLGSGRQRGVVNLGCRLAAGIVGIDSDGHSGKRGPQTIAEHEARLGPLPDTYVIAARGYDEGCGIRLYRTPLDWHGVGCCVQQMAATGTWTSSSRTYGL
jgi:hypothetical protein